MFTRGVEILALLLVSVVMGDDKPLPEVKTPQGTYVGIIIESRGGREIEAFKGVPYAKPPIGSLRFKEPEELDGRDGTFAANQDRKCFQRTMRLVRNDSLPLYQGEEDCLYLNIYRPRDYDKGKKLPVYVYIHGGGFIAGSGGEKAAGPRYLLDNQRNLIMVSINYRLGILGFLSANDVNIPGNNGLKDQALALKWIKENIELFGGDSNSITIGGMSAGAASVAHHLHSKTSQGYFERAISQSGTGDCVWAVTPLKKAREIASNLISFLGCPFDPNQLLECLQSLPPHTLIESEQSLKVENTGIIMYLGPVIEKDSPTAFMTEESIKQGSDKAWITGVTSEEGLLFYHLLLSENEGYMDLSILNEDFRRLLPILAYYGPREGDDEISIKILDHYFGDEGLNLFTVKNFVKLLSDRMFNECYVKSASQHKGKLFLYHMAHRLYLPLTVTRPPGLENDVSHGDDSFLIFDIDLDIGLDLTLNDADRRKSEELVDLLYNFIVHGDPTPESHLWEEAKEELKYFNITNSGNFMSSDTIIRDRVKFFQDLDKQYNLTQY